MNPFDLVVYGYIFILQVWAVFITTVFRVWLLVASILWIWIGFAIVLPNIEFWAHISWLGELVVVEPMLYLFNLFVSIGDTIRADYLIPEENPVKIGFLLLGWLFFIGLSLAIMPLITIGWVVFGYVGFTKLCSPLVGGAMMASAGGEAAPESNVGRIFRGHTTLAKVYDADIQANAIAAAFKKK